MYYTAPPVTRPVTAVGMKLLLVSPVPSCPYWFQPQQSTPPSASSAHVCKYPAARATAPVGRESKERDTEQRILQYSFPLNMHIFYYTSGVKT